jgi:cytochrome c oxidase subunit 1
MDRFFGTNFYAVNAGGDLLLYQHLFWIFGHPEVYILILPAMGIISEVIPVFSRKPLFGYAVVVYSGMLIAIYGFGVWGHHMFAVGMGSVADAVFAGSTMLIAIPTGVKIFNWIATMWGGQIRYTTAMLFAVSFVANFIIGGLSGVMHAAAPSDLEQTDTYFVVAHFHYVLFAGSVQALLAGIYYWWPKITGRLLNEKLGRWHFTLTVVGLTLAFMPMHFIGFLGMPRRVYTYGAYLGLGTLNLISTIGAFVMAAGALVFVWNIWWSLKRGIRAGPNPWNGATLEWAIPSPPPPYNFTIIPTVSSRVPLWSTRAPLAPLPAEPPGPIHLPPGSFWPIVPAVGLVVIAAGGVAHQVWIAVGGLLIVAVGVYCWLFEPFEA